MSEKYFVHETAVVDPGCIIGEGTKIWHFCHIMPNSKIGDNCSLGQNVVISPGTILGNNVKVQNNVSVFTGVECEDDVFLGPSMVFTNVINPRSAIVRKSEYQKTLVKRGATIGANATIICGITIGEFAFIGAGAVVTKSVQPFALITGNPGRHKGWMSEYGHKLQFNDAGIAVCKESGQQYELKNSTVKRIS
ncbi:transferase [Sporocytophaga myxococcoides]|uniref:Transferase n=1 Tax=Sporocytophaga myxococcoides TaxID=153721 RepID=A0A098LA64_9BACT|nr:acyltransferase [Sporocytophaga myxococcoides]GAL83775.1 transferase [Sporocytophaga myxococcoides]